MRFGWVVPSAAPPTTRRRHQRATTTACPTVPSRTIELTARDQTELKWTTALITPGKSELTRNTAQIIPVPAALMSTAVLPSTWKLTTALIVPVRGPRLLSTLHRRRRVQHRLRIQPPSAPLHSMRLMRAATPSPLTPSVMRSRLTNTARRLSIERT